MSEITINGFRFSEDEIQSVTIRRNGEDVTLNRPSDSKRPIAGFAVGHWQRVGGPEMKHTSRGTEV
jgi:hypothetical protein